MAGANSLKTIVYALCANSAIAVAKLGAAFVTGSSAMLADASNQVLLLLGLKRSKRPPDDQHPLGYGKTIYVWSFLDAMVSLKLQMNPVDGDNGLVSAINAFEKDFKHAFPQVVWLFVEPDIAD